MAIQVNTQAAASTAQAAASATTSQAAGPTGPGRRSAPPVMPSFGLGSAMANFGSGGDVYEKIFTKMAAVVKSVNEDQKSTSPLALAKLIKTNHGLNYSAIVVWQNNNGSVAGHILMIEKTGVNPDKLVDTISGVRYEIVRTPADALDQKYIEAAQRVIAAAAGVAQESVIVVDGTLIPNEFDSENEQAIIGLLSNAVFAITSELAIRVSDYKGVNLAEVINGNRNGKFYVSLYFNGEETMYFDQTGMPVRQDVCVALTYKNIAPGNNRSVNQGEEVVEISRTYGYVDFEYTGPKAVAGVMTTQRFVPNFIITGIETGSGRAPTPDLLMLGVASVLAMSEDMNWMQAFRPTVERKNVVDFNDIGALNIEGNIEQSPTGFGSKYDTKSKTVTTIELNRLLQTLVHPTMMISLDLPKAGPMTWATSVFSYIKLYANTAAVTRMRDFMTTVTNGAFANIGTNAPMFEASGNKIHGGFYKSKDGFKDLRCLSSYLSVANHVAATNQSPSVLAGYTNTLYAMSVPQELRAATRRNYIDEMSGKTAVFKQMFDRVTFNGEFLRAWLQSLRTVGFSPIFSNMGDTNDMFVKRATVDFGGAMIGQDMRLMGQNNSAYSTYQGTNNYARSF